MGATKAGAFFQISYYQNFKIMQIYKNPFEVAADATEKINVSSATNDKAAAMFRHRTHSERHGLTNIAAVLLSFLCNTLSGLASGIVAAIVIYKTIEPLNKTFAAIVAALLSIAGVLLVETIKRHTTKETLINAIQYKRFNIGLSGVAIVFSLVSIFSSWCCGHWQRFGLLNVAYLLKIATPIKTY